MLSLMVGILVEVRGSIMVKSWIEPFIKRLYNSLSLKLGFSVGLVVFLTILGYAYFLLKTQEAQSIQKILGTAGMFITH